MNAGAAGHNAAVVDVGLLRLLLDATEARSVDSLALELAIPRERVVAELDRLRLAGCRLEHHPQRGVRLAESGLGAWTDYLESIGGRLRLVVCYRATSSTQDVARGLVESRGRQAEGALVTADQQTAGRGRLGRKWLAPPASGLAMSMVIHPDEALGAIDRLTFAASVAVARTVERSLPHGPTITIKWPNDVLIDGRKVAGILVETLTGRDGRAAIVGIGVNCNLAPQDLPAELRDRVTSLAMQGWRADRLLALGILVRELDRCLDHPVETLLPEWRQRCVMIGQRMDFRTHGQPVRGEVVDLDPHLGLIVRTDRGAITHLPAATTTVVI